MSRENSGSRIRCSFCDHLFKVHGNFHPYNPLWPKDFTLLFWLKVEKFTVEAREVIYVDGYSGKGEKHTGLGADFDSMGADSMGSMRLPFLTILAYEESDPDWKRGKRYLSKMRALELRKQSESEFLTWKQERKIESSGCRGRLLFLLPRFSMSLPFPAGVAQLVSLCVANGKLTVSVGEGKMRSEFYEVSSDFQETYLHSCGRVLPRVHGIISDFCFSKR